MMESGFIRSIREWQKRTAERQKRIQEIINKCLNLSQNDLPPQEMMNFIGSPDEEHFKRVMVHFFSEITNRCYVEPSSKVLDIGCGVGRLAFPFAMYLTEGEYYGCDIWEEGIEFCNSNIASKYPNTRFFVVKMENLYYLGEEVDYYKPNSLEIPIEDNYIDCVFAISVFTHLVRRDIEIYLKEIYRILKPDRIFFVTGFIIDRFFFQYRKSTGKHKEVTEKELGCYYAYKGQDFFAGYTFTRWLSMFEDAGFEIVSYEPGKWAEKPGSRLYQDTFIAVKKNI